MKRSHTVAALLLGGISPILVACGEDAPEATTVFPSVEACAVEMSAADCGTAFAAARQEHQATAPRFASREACEAEMGDGACTPADDAQANGQANNPGGGQGSGMGNVFVPALVGFMVGRSLSGGFSQPVYFDRQGYARTGRTQIGTAPVLPRQDQARQGSGGVATSSGSYYRPGGANAGKSFTVPTTGRSAGFGSTGSSHGFSGS
ncbi:DUF1190 domain-containing protein [Azospirillum doebereinerae]|uniref:DUF1190 domain-containing protein n=1 Tax=Azospirillum doebereinerae TaxID=92933 RepID=UPI001EE56607|nr:DUF1190 domain-containing protein [Azospirillum doebereinerae]MCG5241239.1 DUF1190 domain-containing protein [Azospirillum doebereinerae]